MTNLSNQKPFCTIVDNQNIVVVVVFGDELTELAGNAIDGLIYCFYTAEDKKRYHGDN